MKQRCIGNVNGCLNNTTVVCCVSAKLEMESYATMTSPCYSTPIFCKRWWRWSDAGLIVRAVTVIHHFR